jgi:hypothetical protein
MIIGEEKGKIKGRGKIAGFLEISVKVKAVLHPKKAHAVVAE